jgi:hypothetical protein
VWRRVGAMTNDVPAFFVSSLLKLFKTFPKIQTEDSQWGKKAGRKKAGVVRGRGESRWERGEGSWFETYIFGRHRDI